MTMFDYRNVGMNNIPNCFSIPSVDFIHISIIRVKLFIRSVIRDRNYHNDIKYHLTLNTICYCSCNTLVVVVV